MNSGQFIRRLPTVIRPHIPPGDDPLHIQQVWHLVKIWYGDDPRIHYEVATHERFQLLELGFHCEADAAHNRRIWKQLGFYVLDFKQALGNGVELEEWDKGWIRLYEAHPLYPLDEPRLDDIARRMGQFIAVVHPIYAQVCRALAAGR